MKKIPTLYVRDRATGYVTDEVTPGCEWVLAGEGVPTRKYDGTCVMLDEDGNWWARREVKPGKQPPPNYLPVETDTVTGTTVGWEPIGQSPFVKFWREAILHTSDHDPGTYELIGPKINGNPEKSECHCLQRHASAEHLPRFRHPADLIELCAAMGIEGAVWHHQDGRMAKLKARDYPKASA